MSCHIFVKRGKAVLTPNGLRCQGSRPKDPTLTCNKLLVKRNSVQQVAGAFKCERCGAEIEIELLIRP
jgi:hypothetical protein